jgi:hypothetical protein
MIKVSKFGFDFFFDSTFGNLSFFNQTLTFKPNSLTSYTILPWQKYVGVWNVKLNVTKCGDCCKL